MTSQRLSERSPIFGTLETITDVDSFSIDGKIGSSYTVTLRSTDVSLVSVSGIGDEVAEAFSRESNSVFDQAVFAGSFNSPATLSIMADQDYFLSVSTSSNSISSTDINYEVVLEEYMDDAADNHGTQLSLSELGTVSASSEVLGDRDWIRLELEQGENYRLLADLTSRELSIVAFLKGTHIDSGLSIIEESNESVELAFSVSDEYDYYAVIDNITGPKDYSLSLSSVVQDELSDPETQAVARVNSDYQGNTVFVGDVDFVKIDTDPGKSYLARVTSEDFLLPISGTLVKLNSEKRTFEYYEPLPIIAGETAILNSFTAQDGFEYFMQVNPVNFSGNYRVSVEEYADEASDNADTEAVLSVGESVTVSSPDGIADVEVLRLNLESGLNYVVRSDVRFDLLSSEETGSLFSISNYTDNRVNSSSFNPLLIGESQLGFTSVVSAESNSQYFVSTLLNPSRQANFSVEILENDAPDNENTGLSIDPSTTINGGIEAPGDQDWIRLNVVAGNTYNLSIPRDINRGISSRVFSVDGTGRVRELDLAEPGGAKRFVFSELYTITGRENETIFVQVGIVEDLLSFPTTTSSYSITLSGPVEDDASDERIDTQGPSDQDDTLDGTPGRDLINGLGGRDRISGFQDRDTLLGGDGDDVLRGGLDNDNLRGGDGDDVVRGQNGADRLFGNLGDDTLIGSIGEDTLKGNADDDRLVGGGASDRLFGGAGDDTMIGSAGEDRLLGGAGDDVLAGGTGVDRFIFRQNAGDDVILDFEDGSDLMRIQNGAESFADLTIAQIGADARIDFTGSSITLRDFDVDDLSAADFLF